MRRVRALAKLAVGLTAAVLLAGCSTHPAPPISASQLAAARAFKGYTIYWAGRSIDGIPLTAADDGSNPTTYNQTIGVTLYYGNCESDGVLHVGGCTLPLKITTVLYVPHSNVSLGQQKNVTLRGVPAVIFGGGDDIEIYTDRQSIDIVADNPRRALQAAAALEPFNRVPTANFPAFPYPQFKPGVPPSALATADGATGASGPAAAPPPELQPNPTAIQ